LGSSNCTLHAAPCIITPRSRTWVYIRCIFEYALASLTDLETCYRASHFLLSNRPNGFSSHTSQCQLMLDQTTKRNVTMSSLAAVFLLHIQAIANTLDRSRHPRAIQSIGFIDPSTDVWSSALSGIRPLRRAHPVQFGMERRKKVLFR
jgi:hypothetical protein